MPNINLGPISFTQHSPYVRGTLTYEWTDTAAVSAISGFNASADGISSVTTNLSSANVVVAFDSNVDATVNLTSCCSGGVATVPNDYNKDILLIITADLQVGQVHSATTNSKRVIKHLYKGTSDTTLTSTPANPTFTDVEVLAGTTKSLGSFAINTGSDSGTPTYTATITYRKDLGTITYSDTSIVNSTGADKDIITTNNESTLNTVLGNMQYIPDINSSPASGVSAILGDTITLSLESTADTKINNAKNVQITTTISNTLALANTVSPNITFSELEMVQATRKAPGSNISATVINNSSVTVNCVLTYNKSRTSIIYPDTSIVDSTQPTHDTLSSTNMATINTALQTMTILPLNDGSSGDLEGIGDIALTLSGFYDSIAIEMSTTPHLPISNSSTTLPLVHSNTGGALTEELETGIPDHEPYWHINTGDLFSTGGTALTMTASLLPPPIRYSRNNPEPFFQIASSELKAGSESVGGNRLSSADTFTDLIKDNTFSVGTEIYALVWEPADGNLGTIEFAPTSTMGITGISSTTTALAALGLPSSTFSKYAGTGAQSEIGSNAVIMQGKKADLNEVLRLVTREAGPLVNDVGWTQGATGRSRANYAIITGATQANPVVITAKSLTSGSTHSFQNGEYVAFQGASGLINDLEGSLYKVANRTTTTFELNTLAGANVDGTSLSAFAGSGTNNQAFGLKGAGLYFVPNWVDETANLKSSVYSLRLYRAPAGTSSSIDINSSFSTFTKIYESTGAELSEKKGGLGIVANGTAGSLTALTSSNEAFTGLNHPGFNMSRSATHTGFIVDQTAGSFGFRMTSPNAFSTDENDHTPWATRKTPIGLFETTDVVGRVFVKTNFSTGSDYKSGHSYIFGVPNANKNDFSSSTTIVTGNGNAVGSESTVYTGFTEIGRYGGDLGTVMNWMDGFQHRGPAGSNAGPVVGDDWTYRFSIEIRDASGPQSDTTKMCFTDVKVTMIT